MSTCRRVWWCVALWVVIGTPLKAAEEPLQTARQLWAVTDLVLEKHITPPSRQEMLLTALRSMTVSRSVAADLSRKVSAVTTPEQLAPLLQELWPQTKDGKPAAQKELTLVQAMFQGIPGTPQVVPPDQYKVLEQISNNRYVGTGIQVGWNPRENLVEILNPFPGGPARKAGARPNDLIVEVDGVNMAKVPLGKVVEALRGEEGSTVSVVVRQNGSTEKRTLQMTRAVVPFEMLVGYTRVGEDDWNYRVQPDAPVAYVRAVRITSSALHELRQIERRLQADGCRALILDLRFTVEGDVQHGARVADAFLESGLMGQVRDRQNNVKEYKADPDCLFRNWPVAVLVSTATRGAGVELLAAALQDNRRAVLIGETTPGDVLVTSTVALPGDLGFARLPTAALERAQPPRARERDPVRNLGVQPDHVVPLSQEQRRVLTSWLAQQEKPGGAPEAKAPADAALAKALEILRAKQK